MNTPLTSVSPTPPALFVSYSWTNDEHVAWVANLARRLRANGVDVHLDKWDVRVGYDLNLYMERYAEQSARVLVVLSDDYGPKADGRAERSTGVGTETAIVSPTVYRQLGGNRVVPVVPSSGTVADQPVVPRYLAGRSWIDFRRDYEAAYEQLLRELHGVPIEVAPPLGTNPFAGTTDAQAQSEIHNHPARWHAGQTRDRISVNLNENSGQFTIGTGEASFKLNCDYPSAIVPGPREVRHYNDYIGRIGLVKRAAEYPERFTHLPVLPMSNRVESTEPGDVLVMVNRQGYWALLMLDDVEFLLGPNGLEPVALMRYVIGTDRSAALTLADLPHPPAASSPEERADVQ